MFKFVMLFLISILSAKAACLKEGASAGFYPGALDCCAGLEIKPPPAGMIGSRGTCIKKKTCLEAGEHRGVYPGALDCCPGLDVKLPPVGVNGSGGTCIKKEACVKEGDYLRIYPSDECCVGLERQLPPEGQIGSGGQCVKNAQPAPAERDDSYLQYKDMLPSEADVRPKTRKAIKK